MLGTDTLTLMDFQRATEHFVSSFFNLLTTGHCCTIEKYCLRQIDRSQIRFSECMVQNVDKNIMFSTYSERCMRRSIFVAFVW